MMIVPDRRRRHCSRSVGSFDRIAFSPDLGISG